MLADERMKDKWVDFRRWNLAWEKVQDLPGGGQGSVKEIRSRIDDSRAFLKVLNKQQDTERRARFFREATAYDTFEHAGIPKLLQSNSHLHSDLNYQLYIATEFIPGCTLSNSIAQNGTRSFDAALNLIRNLLDIVAHLHGLDWVHRDIKPDNIMLSEGLLDRPLLVDFGLCYKDDPSFETATEHGDEIGNRFLRLPELSSGSTAKRDPRSDIAFLGGILFYSLTGTPPFSVMDSDGRMPHQRLEFSAGLKSLAGDAFLELQDFFDHCFSQKLSARFSSADEMKVKLDALMTRSPQMAKITTEEQLAEIRKKLDTEVNRNLAKLKVLYDRAMGEIRGVHAEIAQSFLPTYVAYQGGYVNFTEGLRNTLGFTHFATHNHRFAPEFLISAIGEELVITVDGNPLYRADVNTPVFDDRFRSQIRNLYIEGMNRLLETSIQTQ
jgi:serine/threonine-protein kinase